MHIKSPWGHCLSTSYSIECLESITFVKRKKTSSKKTPWSMLLNYSTLTSFSENYTCLKRKRPMMIKTWSKTNYLRQMKGTRMPSLTMSHRILKFKWCKQDIWLTKRRPSRTSRISFYQQSFQISFINIVAKAKPQLVRSEIHWIKSLWDR